MIYVYLLYICLIYQDHNMLYFYFLSFSFCIFFLSGMMCFSLLHHISSLSVSSEHSNFIFILRTEDAGSASFHIPHSLWVDTRLWGDSPLIIAFLAWILRWFFWFWEWEMVIPPSELPKCPTESASEKVSCGMQTCPSLIA